MTTTRTSTLSLAARIHLVLDGSRLWRGDLDQETQRILFGCDFSENTVDTAIMLMPDSTINVVFRHVDQPTQMMSLEDIQSTFEAREARENGWDDEPNEFIYPNHYRQFPVETSAFVTVENKVLGRRYEMIGTDLDEARKNYARYNGYEDWAEMRALAPEGDRDEDWTVTWGGGSPDELNRKTVERLEQEEKELHAAIREDKAGAIFNTYMKEQAKLFDLDWAGRDPDGYAAHKAHCTDLHHKHKAAIEENTARIERLRDVMDLLEVRRAALRPREFETDMRSVMGA